MSNKLLVRVFNKVRWSSGGTKYAAETAFWVKEISLYKDWYEGKLKRHYGHEPPQARQKIKANNLKDSAILTWFSVHQKPKYLADLKLDKNAFKDMRLLDIGAGPMPSAAVFTDCEIYSLDPLYSEYIAAGYPLHYYDRVKFVNAYSEDIPIEDNYFDAAISVNAIDHVDSLAKTAKEIERVLRPNGKFAMHVHYHEATEAEPLELNDKIFIKHFGWVKNLRKTESSQSKYGSVAEAGEEYALWRNF